MISVLILMAGSSEAFQSAGYQYPKNLIEIDGQPLIQRVLEKLGPFLRSQEVRLICVLPHKESMSYFTSSVVRLVEPAAKIVELPGTTRGAACSSLLAVDLINNPDALIITNGDQIIDWSIEDVIGDFVRRDLDAGCIVFEDIHPRWSFVKCDTDGLVVEAAEKRPISNKATAGFYYFKHGSDYVKAAMSMIKKDAKVNDLFYICPSFNELILLQKRIGTYEIPKRCYISLATPASVESYISTLISTKSTKVFTDAS